MATRKPGTARSRLGTHLNQRVSKQAAKLDDHKILLGVIVMVVGAFLAYVAFVSTTGPPFQSKYQVTVEVPADAPPLRVGQAVRIGGKLAGLISDVEPDRENGGTLVTANITKTEFRPIGTDATANVRVHSIVYHTYLELYPGDPERNPMENGGMIEQANVTSGVDLLEVVQLFDAEARESLRESVVNIGYGLAGRGAGLNATLKDLGPVARNTASQLEAATRDEDALGSGLAGLASVSEGLEGDGGDDLAGLLSSGDTAFGTLAGRSTELAEAIRRLPGFEDEFIATAPVAEPLLDELTEATVELEPAVRGLNAALPEVNTLLSLSGELRSESARITAVAVPVLETTKPLVRTIYPIVASLDPILEDVDTVVANVGPYKDDIVAAGKGLAAATSVLYPQGNGLGAGAPMGRVITVLGCHSNRNPLPGPGQGVRDSEAC